MSIKPQEKYMDNQVNNSYHLKVIMEPTFIGDVWDEHIFSNQLNTSDVERDFWKPDEEFVNPEPDNPVRKEDFLKYLDLSRILPKLEKMYVEDWELSFTFPKEAMLKIMIYFKLKRYKFLTEVWRDLVTSPTLADNLGFEKIPNYNTFYHFLIKRIGSQGIKKIFDAFVEANRKELLKYNIELGKEIGLDASPIPAKRNDKDADWYARPNKKPVWAYMWHNLRCMDTNLPLEFHLTRATEDEGHFFAPFIYRLKMIKDIHPDRVYVDCGYSSFENIARANVYWDIQIKSNIADNWKLHPEATYKELERRYNKLWKKDYYKNNPTTDEMLLTLIGSKKPNFVAVGWHYRNDILAIYEECPDGYMDDYSLRNRVEGSHGYEKKHYNLKEIEAKGIERVTTHIGMHLISVLAVSLCRLQNGVSEGLTETAGLI